MLDDDELRERKTYVRMRSENVKKRNSRRPGLTSKYPGGSSGVACPREWISSGR